MSQQARCPSCGAAVEFKVGTSLVTVCPYCRSVVGRGDKGLEDLGKVADLAETGSPLDLWLKGRFDGVPFTLTGRVQYSHPAGGVWDEWYAAFADGRWGWLAEAQGRFYLTFAKTAPPDLPRFDSLKLGQSVKVADTSLVVAEKNTARTAAARGEIPFRLVPGSAHPFADLSGPEGAFGTLDYSEAAPQVFLGRQVTLDELGIPKSARRKVTFDAPRPEAVSLNCPQCGAALSLRAPDRSERVGCPSCGSLLDVKEGKLRLLQSLKPPEVQPALPLGAVAEYDGTKWTALGFLRRAVTIEGTDYFWEEYLLYQPRLGFRWLTVSDGHWSWVEPLPPGAVRAEGKHAHYAGRGYSLFQKATARVVFVIGEFYWKVQAGEKVLSRDYVHAPYMLSEEVSKEGDGGEINWSHATYLPPEQVEKMFAIKQLPPPTGVGPNQPFPLAGVYRYALYLLAAAVALAVLVWLFSPRRKVFQESYTLQPPPAGQATRRVIVEPPLELRGRRNIRVTLKALSGSWVHLEGELDRQRPPPTPGAADSSSWRPRRATFSLTAYPADAAVVYLSAVPRGSYGLQFDAQWAAPTQPTQVEVSVEQGVAHPMPFVVVALLLAAAPFVVGLYQLVFEARRWQGSNVT